ncbi:NACHT domain-containing protein [Vibrio parahaemolyticus]|uniref:NACHT domain-containing protein n=2 Tax=Vibrio parahaemolyticus TaxID=670 RepID=UPI0029E68B4C|nr:NACHT domain-containing protein [Vibrio parahaemolyticus]MDF4736315.1 NACHT domain-containing protein [Vibrio parahaemolyticus]HCG8176843.1 NACHT domain-containing protein [Vibrio parahaemolyticus]
MDPITTTALTVTVTEVVKRATSAVMDGSWSSDLEPAKHLLHQLLDGYARDQFTNRYVINVLKMRTLHSPDSDVYLNDVYTPLRLRPISDTQCNYEIKVKNDKVIQHSGIVNIVGIAGQGKSTVMRKLFWEELKKSKRIPFFIELRKVETTIIDYLKGILTNIGLVCSDDDVGFLLQSKKVVLMLDGFDEISTNDRPRILNEIMNVLHMRFHCPVITSSRPDTEICREVGVNTYIVQPLEVEEVLFLLEKLNSCGEGNELSDLVRSNVYLQETLITPILVNLLFVCYPFLDAVPENVSDFYSKLFMTLFQRHDKIKNYKRERVSGCTDEQVNNIFNSFCFNSFNKGHADFTDQLLHKYISSSLRLEDLDPVDASKIVTDIIQITCLLQQDGFDRYLFLHKSIQEFHAARFLADCRHERKQSIYSQILRNIDRDQKWDNVINFLSKIDEDDFLEMFLIAKCHKEYIGYIKTNSSTVVENAINNMAENKNVHLTYNSQSGSLEFELAQSIQVNTLISTLNLLRYGERKLENTIEKPLENAVRQMDEIMSNISSFSSPEKFIDDALNVTITKVNESSTGSQKIAIPILDYLKILGQYNLLEEAVRDYLESYHRDFFLPIEVKLNNADQILDLEFKVS